MTTLIYVFFFQAEDGIRDYKVTGVQTCALPICRPLVCAYHAWRYDAQGRVANIPDCDQLYQFGKCELKNLKLREFSLRAVGNILFINLDADPLPLEEQFSSASLHLLANSSDAYDTEAMVTTWEGRYNWKLAYENLRDANHPRFVHPKTLAKDRKSVV